MPATQAPQSARQKRPMSREDPIALPRLCAICRRAAHGGLACKRFFGQKSRAMLQVIIRHLWYLVLSKRRRCCSHQPLIVDTSPSPDRRTTDVGMGFDFFSPSLLHQLLRHSCLKSANRSQRSKNAERCSLRADLRLAGSDPQKKRA